MPRSPLQFSRYIEEVQRLAIAAGVDTDTFSTVVKYSERLNCQNLPIIFDENHFSRLVGYSAGFLYACANGTRSFYRRYEIKKKNGGVRTISEPYPGLKEVQRWLLDALLSKVAVSPAAKAYAPGSNIKSNAKFHIGQRVVIRLDAKDFFPSIRIGSVYDLFYSLGYTKPLATLFAHLCCLEGALPQGAPSSAALSNVLLRDLDAHLLKWAKQNQYRYTRYADDLTFSGAIKNERELIQYVSGALSSEGLKLNYAKIAVIRSGARQMVTGLVVNEKLNVPRSVRRDYRQHIYYLKKYGLDGHSNRIKEFRKNFLMHLIGIGEYISWVDEKNTWVRSDIEFLQGLKKSYLENVTSR